jgi:hypothetical protein
MFGTYFDIFCAWTREELKLNIEIDKNLTFFIQTDIYSDYNFNDQRTDYSNYGVPTTSNYDYGDYSISSVNRPVSSLDCFFDFGINRNTNKNRQNFSLLNIFDWFIGSNNNRYGDSSRFGGKKRDYNNGYSNNYNGYQQCSSNDYKCRFSRFGRGNRRGHGGSRRNSMRSDANENYNYRSSNCFDFLA